MSVLMEKIKVLKKPLTLRALKAQAKCGRINVNVSFSLEELIGVGIDDLNDLADELDMTPVMMASDACAGLSSSKSMLMSLTSYKKGTRHENLPLYRPLHSQML